MFNKGDEILSSKCFQSDGNWTEIVSIFPKDLEKVTKDIGSHTSNQFTRKWLRYNGNGLKTTQ